jgi:hypothetical protein
LEARKLGAQENVSGKVANPVSPFSNAINANPNICREEALRGCRWRGHRTTERVNASWRLGRAGGNEEP